MPSRATFAVTTELWTRRTLTLLRAILWRGQRRHGERDMNVPRAAARFVAG